MPVFKNIVSTEAVAEGLLVTFDFRRESGDHVEYNETTEDMETIQSAVRDETTVFLFPTEQVESLRVASDESERTDDEIVEILTDRCLENLKAV